MVSKPVRVQDVRSLARGYTDLCIRSLGNIVEHGENEAARVAAANILLNRGWGNTAAQVDADGEIIVEIRQIVRRLGEPQLKTIEHDDG